VTNERHMTRRKNAEPAREDGPFRTPAVDIRETPGELVLLADMPGVDDKGLQVSIEENTLTIVGNPVPTLPENARTLHAEIEPHAFRRAFTLSNDLQLDAVEGSIKHGLLTLTLPKARGAKVRRIPIKSE